MRKLYPLACPAIIILDTLAHFGLGPTCKISRGYDGATIMGGRCSGVQQPIKEVAPPYKLCTTLTNFVCPLLRSLP